MFDSDDDLVRDDRVWEFVDSENASENAFLALGLIDKYVGEGDVESLRWLVARVASLLSGDGYSDFVAHVERGGDVVWDEGVSPAS